jgi:hypothetical protein
VARQWERHVLDHRGNRIHRDGIAGGESVDDLLDEHLRRRGAGGEAELADALEGRPVDLLGPEHQAGDRAADALGDFAQALRVRGVRGPDDDDGIDQRRHLLDRFLAVGGGVADVVLVRTGDGRELRLQGGDDVACVVHRQGRLRHPGEVVAVLRLQGGDLLQVLDQGDRAGGQLAHGADDLRVAGMADEQHVAAPLMMDLGLAVDFRHQRAGGVDGGQPARIGVVGHRLGDAVGGEDHRGRAVRHLVELAHEDRALSLQALDHVLVVDDLMTDVDRRSVDGERPLHHVDGSHHTGAEAARCTEQDFQGRLHRLGGDGGGGQVRVAHDSRDVARLGRPCQPLIA